MNPAPFRKFLARNVYDSAEDLVDDAINSGPSLPFVVWVLGLRECADARHPFPKFYQQYTVQKIGRTPKIWYTCAVKECFDLWRPMRMCCCPRKEHPFDNDAAPSKSGQRKFAPVQPTSNPSKCKLLCEPQPRGIHSGISKSCYGMVQ